MTKAPLLHLASQVFDSPLAIIPEKLDAILRAVGPRFVTDQAALSELLHSGALTSTHRADHLIAPSPDSSKGYCITDDGVAILPITGVLMKKGGWMTALSGCSSYEQIEDQVEACMDDPQVRAILFDLDSPGGTTHGCFELSDFIYSLRGTKPMFAIADDLAASAAYALASAADKLYVTRTAAVGSIGVFALHQDVSQADEKMGVKYTFVHAGDKKIDGNPHEPLSRSAKKDIQAEVDREYDIFVETVARNRGKGVAAISGTEAGVLFADLALPLLADVVGDFDTCLADLTQLVTGDRVPVTGRAVGSTKRASSQAAGKQEEVEMKMPAIPPHKTATSTKPWDGPANKKRLSEGESASYYRKAYAFAKPDGPEDAKAGYTFIHHEISGDGSVGAANLKGCSSSIAILNGGRTGTVLKGEDRKGVYRHVSAHLKNGGQKPSPLKSYREYLDGVEAYATEIGNEELLAAAQAAQIEALIAPEPNLEGDTDMTRDAKRMDDGKKADDMEDRKGKKADDADDAEDGKKGKKMKKADDADDADDAEDGKRGKHAEDADDAEYEGKKEPADDGKDDDDDEKDEPDDDEDDKKKKDGKKGRKAVTAMPSRALEATAIIAETCELAGFPEKAASYIAKFSRGKLSIAAIREELLDLRAAESQKTAVSSGFGTVSFDALDSITKQAQVLTQSNPKLAQSKALEAVILANPQLYESFKEERFMAAQSPKGQRDYITRLQQRLPTLGLSGMIG